LAWKRAIELGLIDFAISKRMKQRKWDQVWLAGPFGISHCSKKTFKPSGSSIVTTLAPHDMARGSGVPSGSARWRSVILFTSITR
jgi:hypothetical protein